MVLWLLPSLCRLIRDSCFISTLFQSSHFVFTTYRIRDCATFTENSQDIDFIYKHWHSYGMDGDWCREITKVKNTSQRYSIEGNEEKEIIRTCFMVKGFFFSLQTDSCTDTMLFAMRKLPKENKYMRKSGRLMAYVHCLVCVFVCISSHCTKTMLIFGETTDEKIMIKYGNLSAARILLIFVQCNANARHWWYWSS